MRLCFVTGGPQFISSPLLHTALAVGHDTAALRRPGSELRISWSCETPTVIKGTARTNPEFRVDHQNKMERLSTDLPGVYILQPRRFQDARGSFVKTFHRETFRDLGLDGFSPAEEFYSVSGRNVIRGMHFQIPPADHAKLVYCPHGAVLDVVLDLRRNSPTAGRFIAVELSAASGRSVFVPVGCAHGFLSREDDTLMIYQTSTVHSPTHDAGVRWNSFGFHWPCEAPVMSERDRNLPALAEFASPF